MKNYCSEEIRQVLSVVNYKVIMYTLLLQQSKGVVSLVKKISGLEAKAVEETRKALSLEQMMRIRKMIHHESEVPVEWLPFV